MAEMRAFRIRKQSEAASKKMKSKSQRNQQLPAESTVLGNVSSLLQNTAEIQSAAANQKPLPTQPQSLAPAASASSDPLPIDDAAEASNRKPDWQYYLKLLWNVLEQNFQLPSGAARFQDDAERLSDRRVYIVTGALTAFGAFLILCYQFPSLRPFEMRDLPRLPDMPSFNSPQYSTSPVRTAPVRTAPVRTAPGDSLTGFEGLFSGDSREEKYEAARERDMQKAYEILRDDGLSPDHAEQTIGLLQEMAERDAKIRAGTYRRP